MYLSSSSLFPISQHYPFEIFNQSPSPGRRAAPEAVVATEVASNEQNGDSAAEARAPLTSAQRIAAASASASMVEVPADPYGKEAKHFTEIRVLHRDVSIF